MNNQQKPQLWTRNFVLLSTTNLVMFLGFHMLMSTFPFFVRHLGGNEVMVGLIAGLFSVSSLLMRPAVGWYLDNKNRRILLWVGLAGLAACTMIYSILTAVMLVLVFRLIHGVFWAATSTSLSTNVSDILPKSRFSEGMGFFGVTATISMSIAPFIGLVVMEKLGFTKLFYSSAILSLLSLILALRIGFMRIEKKKEKATFSKSLKKLINKSALPASIVMFFFMIPYGSITTFIALYSVDVSIGSGGVFFILLAVSNGLSRLFSGRICDKKGEDIIVYIAIPSVVTALILLGFFMSSVTFYIAAILYGIGFGSMAPSMQAMAVRIASPERRGAASSTYLSAFDMGIGSGGMISGVLVKYFGYGQMYAIMSLWLVISFGCYFFWARKSASSFHYGKDNAR